MLNTTAATNNYAKTSETKNIMTHNFESNKYESSYANTAAGSYESGYDSSSSSTHVKNAHISTHANSSTQNTTNDNYDYSDWTDKDFFYEEEYNRFNQDILELTEYMESANGVLYTGVSGKTGDDVMVKKIWKQNVAEIHQWEGRDCPNEVYFHLRCFHASPDLVVPLLDWYEFEDFYLISMAKIPECTDLFAFVRNTKETISECRAAKIFKQLATVAYDLHKAKICHRDFKDENFLISTGDHIYLIDFGTTMNYESSYSDCVGTPCFFSPEYFYAGFFRPEELTSWSLGAILYIMLAKNWRWSYANESWSRDKNDEKDLSPGAKKILDGVLHENPEKRLKLLEILESDWLNSF